MREVATANPMGGRQIIGLDLIRFAAAASVMFFHLDRLGVPGAWAGWIGVDVFFVLSGYVITLSAEHAAPASLSIGRFVRLMAGIWICGAVGVAIGAKNGVPLLALIALHTAVIWPVGPWASGVYWTLPVEVAFYSAVWL